MGQCTSTKNKHMMNNIQVLNSSLLEEFRINCSFCIYRSLGHPLDKYDILKVLGEGSYGKVFLVRQKYTGILRAMKEINKANLKNTEIENEIINEVTILKKVDHPNIVKIHEFFVTESKYFLLTEYCKYGELYKKIIKNSPFDESYVAFIMYQLMSAVYYCHCNNIIHRDIKPENILIDGYDFQGSYLIKLIDYGNAKVFEKNKSENKVIGSCYYVAPEVLNKNYTDIWSCGVIMYLMLSGKTPFFSVKEEDILTKIKEGRFNYDLPVWGKISEEAKDLINKMLEYDPNNRISAGGSLDHPWFRKLKMKERHSFISKDKLSVFFKNLRNYNPSYKLQHAALALIVHNVPMTEEIKELSMTFRFLDENSDGKLTKEELVKGLASIIPNNEELKCEVENIFKRVDNDKSGFIEYQEFIRACINKEHILDETNLRFAFQFFDKDGSGQITVEELQEVFAQGEENYNVSLRVLKLLVEEIDTNKDGQISYEEFRDMMIKIMSNYKMR
jgi:calcium-dependent protein kinase